MPSGSAALRRALRLPPPVGLTCFQVPQVLAADLVVPGLSIAITPTPNVEAGIDCYSAVASSGPGNIVLQCVHQDGLPGHGIWGEREAEVSKGAKDPTTPTSPLAFCCQGWRIKARKSSKITKVEKKTRKC